MTVFLLKSPCSIGSVVFSPGSGPILTTGYLSPSPFFTNSANCINANSTRSRVLRHDSLWRQRAVSYQATAALVEPITGWGRALQDILQRAGACCGHSDDAGHEVPKLS